MKHIKAILVMFALAIGLSAAARAADSIGYFDAIKNDPAIKLGETYYMRHNLMYEKDSWDATNYWRGVLLAINTKVKVETLGSSSMILSWDGGSVKIENSKNTKRDMATLAKEMLSPNLVPIDQFGADMAKNIATGQLVKGMTREQVIMTRGYPPAHKTPNINAETGKWIYWSSRFITETVTIKDGKLDEGRNVAK